MTQATPINLGQAGPDQWVLLAVGTRDAAGQRATSGKITINNESSVNALGATPTRDIGVAGSGSLQMSGNGSVDGAARFGTGSGLSITTGNVIGGGIFGLNLSGNPKGNSLTAVDQSPLLEQAHSDALAASAFAAALAASPAFADIANITSTRILEGGAGLNVVNLTDLVLGNNKTLTLDGNGLGGSFLINVGDEFKLNSADIVLTGGWPSTTWSSTWWGPGRTSRSAGGATAPP